jgi:hypothetical protein
VGKIPGFSRRTGNFIDVPIFPAEPPFGRKNGQANQSLPVNSRGSQNRE